MATVTPKKTVIGEANAEGLPFSEAIKLGNLVFVSGTVGFDESGKLVAGGVGPETGRFSPMCKRYCSRRAAPSPIS